MSEPLDRIGIHKWTLESRQEPLVRVGVVLPEDGATSVRMDAPDVDYRLHPVPEGTERPARSFLLRVDEERLSLVIDGRIVDAAPCWRIIPPVADRAHPPLIMLHDVVAGRGFHWEKRITQKVPGAFQASVRDGRILLINEIPIEDYLKGVITAEMGGECPMDLLKAQCVTARTWLLARTERKHEAQGFDFCNDDCCQRYQGFTHLTPAGHAAVEETRGEVMIHRSGILIDANYSKCCGGVVEGPEPVWGFHKPGQYVVADAPPNSYARRFVPLQPGQLDEYLTGDWLKACDVFCSPNVVSPEHFARYLGAVDEAGSYFRWTVEYPRSRLEEILRAKFFERTGIGGREALGELLDLAVTRRGHSGRATALNVVYRDPDERRRTVTIEDQYWIRHALHEKFLFSSAFKVAADRDPADRLQTIRLIGAGWGHGAGLCQIGALGMALQGYDHATILHHYFEQMNIQRAY